MLRLLWSLLLMLLILAVTSACEQPSEQENSGSESVSTTDGIEEDLQTGIDHDNDETASEGVIDNQKDKQDDMVYFEEDGLSFSYPDFIGGEIRSETVAASDEDAFMVYPEHEMITFNDYLLADTMISPQIQIFPLEEYLALDEYNAEIIELAKLILTSKSIPDSTIEAPYVPQPLAAQIFYANFNFIENQAVSGFRYITQYGQDLGPVTNDYLFYTYQGISADNRYYISATFPVYHPDLPSDFEDYFKSSGIDYNTFEENYPDYLDKSIQMLDQAASGDFIPALDLLDSIMSGLIYE